MSIAEWIDDNIGSHSNVYIKKLSELEQFGIDVKIHGGQCVLSYDDKNVTIHGSSWEDSFESHKRVDHMGFCVIRPDKEIEEPEAFYCSDDSPLPKDEKGELYNDRDEQAYVVVKYQEQTPPFGGWIWDTPEARSNHTASGFYIASQIAWLILDENPGSEYFGRGSSHRACIRAIAEWEQQKAQA